MAALATVLDSLPSSPPADTAFVLSSVFGLVYTKEFRLNLFDKYNTPDPRNRKEKAITQTIQLCKLADFSSHLF